MLSTILFNLGMFAVDFFALKNLQKRTNARLLFVLAAMFFFTAGMLSVLLGKNTFDHFRLMCYAIFLHLTLFCLLSAFIFFHRNKVVAVALIILCFLFLGIAIDAFLIEPKQLEVSTFHLSTKKLRSPLRILIFSDLQGDQFGEFEKNAFIVAMSQKPDLILMTGDYFQTENVSLRNSLITTANNYVKRIQFNAPLGVYAVKGDVEDNNWPRLFSGTEVKTILQSQSFSIGETQITALDRNDSRKINLNVPPANHFHIVFGHSPNFARGKIHADLLIAGHTHGGQVQLPFLGPLYVHSKIPREWGSGLTSLHDGKTLIVSRGIGMERGLAPRMRFLCKPELVVVELTPL